MEANEGFNGFDEGFAGLSKHLPEDCVEYSLYIIDSNLKSSTELLGQLQSVRKEALNLTGSLLTDYIWQREDFRLDFENEKGMMYLRGRTNYGDSVEDEWLIVYILRELSNRFPLLWIKVVDTDGEFLLIEAANALPRWLNPEIAENRVWIHNNALCIIPLGAASPSGTGTATVSRPLSLEEAHKTITSTPDDLIRSSLIEEEAFYRLRNYPSQIKASLHHAVTLIPRKLAWILHARPASIAPAVEAFYLRDPIAMKSLQAKTSDLIFPPDDLFAVSTRFTKVMYAQLKSQQFSPPIAWKDLLSNAETNAATDSLGPKRHAMLELGMKVTSGFEMVLNDPNYGDSRAVREVKILLDDLATDDSLSLPTDEEIADWRGVGREDEDTWMNINFEDFERELKGERKQMSGAPGGLGSELPSGFGDTNIQADLKKMVERFESFLNDDNAGIDGAEDDMDIDDDEDTDDDSEDEDRDVSFDENEFARMMREMMGMPSEEPNNVFNGPLVNTTARPGKDIKIKEADAGDVEDTVDESSEMRKVMENLEAELNEAGAFDLNPTPSKLTVLKGKGKAEKDDDNEDARLEDESDEEINVDFNLAKNLLESFKSQAGMAGPTSNMLGLMGIQIPRDDGDSDRGNVRR